MKKITFLFAMLLLATTSFAQTVLFTEDFESGGGAWTDQNLGDGDTGWTFDTGVVPGGGATNDFTTLAAIFDDDNAGNDSQHDSRMLWHGPEDVSNFYSVTLNYEYALNVIGDNLELLHVSLWDNANSAWINIKTYGVDTDPTADSIDVSAAIAANPGIDPTNLFFGFGYDDLDGDWAWGAGIDNVELTGLLSNDFCIYAIDVTVNPAGTGCTSPTIASNFGATDSSPFNGTPACGSFAGGDIWFTFTAPATGDIKIIVPEVGEWSSFATAIYIGGTCSDTPELACEVNYDINMVANIPSEVTYTGLTPGDSYVLRAWDFSNDQIGEVSFCIEEFDSTASVNEETIEGLSLFPNPAKDVLNVQSQDIISKVAIYNLIGQEVRVLTPNTSSLEIDLNGLDAGMYIVKVLSNDKEMSKKFIKQ